MKRRSFVVIFVGIFLGIMFGMANNKPLDLEKNTQSLIDGMGYEECYILKFAGEKNIENIHLDVKPTNDEIEEKIETKVDTIEPIKEIEEPKEEIKTPINPKDLFGSRKNIFK